MTTPRRRTATPDPSQAQEVPVTLLETPDEIGTTVHARSGLSDRVPALRPLSPVPTYIGIAVAASGFVAILIAWSRTAGLDNVALQIPYLISAGMTGLGLIMVGVTVVSVASRRRDAVLREQQTALLADALRELGASMEPGR